MYSYHSTTIESESGTKLCDGVILSFTSDQITIHLAEIDKININDIILVNIFTKTNGCIIYKGIAKLISNNTLTVDCVVFIKEIQRRKSHRMSISIPLHVSKINKHNENSFKLDKPILMKARDISINGILLESPLDIPDNIQFNINLPLQDKVLNIVTDTMRKYQKDSLFYYGCTFILNNEEEHAFLRKFINSNYIYQIKNKNPKMKLYPQNKN